jgi:RNA polymerase sigma-70 factor (sigma-E family)
MLDGMVERAEPAEHAKQGRLGELYLRHATGATRLAYLLTGDRALAEDLVQDAFVRLAGRLAHLRDEGAFEPYLRRTIVNLARSHWRRRKVERSYLERIAPHGRLRPEPSHQPDVEEHEEMWRALSLLPARQRAALVLRFYEDLSEREIADVLRCPVGTVKSLVSRGLATLRSDMRPREDGGEER